MPKAKTQRAGKYQEKLKIAGDFENVAGVQGDVPAKVAKLRNELKRETKAFIDGLDKHSDYEILKALQIKIRAITNQLKEYEGKDIKKEK